MSIWRNDTKGKNTFLIPLEKLACKGLIKDEWPFVYQWIPWCIFCFVLWNRAKNMILELFLEVYSTPSPKKDKTPPPKKNKKKTKKKHPKYTNADSHSSELLSDIIMPCRLSVWPLKPLFMVCLRAVPYSLWYSVNACQIIAYCRRF